MRRIVDQLKRSERVLVVSHVNPDGDALGSQIAVGRLLDAIGKGAVLYNESPIPAVYRFLPDTERIVRRVDRIDDFDTAVVLDCSHVDRIGDLAGRIDAVPTVINIDHHRTNSCFGHIPLVDATACASAEIVHRLIRLMEVPLTVEMATAIYTGILTDTGSFRLANTNQAAFAICHEMVATGGVEPYKVAERIYGAYSLGRIRLLNRALDSIELSHGGELSVMTLTQSVMEATGTCIEDTEGIINYAKSIRKVRLAALLIEGEGGDEITQGISPFYVSLRSDGSIDVSELASRFGGGGHRRAAGFSVEMTMDDLRSEIADWFEEKTLT